MNSDRTQRKQLQSSSGGIQSSVRTVARLDNHMGKTLPRLLPYHTQINSRFIKNLHVEKRNSKALLSNIGERIHDLRVEKSFLNKAIKSLIVKERLICNFSEVSVHQKLHEDNNKSSHKLGKDWQQSFMQCQLPRIHRGPQLGGKIVKTNKD